MYRLQSSLCVIGVTFLCGNVALARDPSADATLADVSAPDGGPVAPILKDHPEPIYPSEALQVGIAGNVELELTIDESGHVVDATVVNSAGHGFDEAALAVIRSWTFAPAEQNGQPIRAAIRLALPFVPPTVQEPARESKPTSASARPVTAKQSADCAPARGMTDRRNA